VGSGKDPVDEFLHREDGAYAALSVTQNEGFGLMLPDCGVHGIKAAQQPDFFAVPHVPPEPLFQGAGGPQAGHVNAYQIGGAIFFIDLKNRSLHVHHFSLFDTLRYALSSIISAAIRGQQPPG
jgi:hypothetical protein